MIARLDNSFISEGPRSGFLQGRHVGECESGLGRCHDGDGFWAAHRVVLLAARICTVGHGGTVGLLV
jgi:hypothetical protein